MDDGVYITIDPSGAGLIIARALELLVTIEHEEETHGTVETEIVEEAKQLRAVVDEWVIWHNVTTESEAA